MNYETDISIDPNQLDTEWLEQSTLTLKYTQHEAHCRKVLDTLKSELDILKADLDLKIRSNPSDFGLSKTTETAIGNAILSVKDFTDKQAEVREAEYELNMAQAAVRSIYAKKDALENLVRLFGQQYFAGPSVPRDISKEWEDKQRQKSSNRKVVLKRRK